MGGRGVASGHGDVHKLASRLQIECLALFGEHERRDGVDVLLLHALDLHLPLERRQRIDADVAEIAQTRQTVLVVACVLPTHVVRVADAANSRALHRRQLELAHWLQRRQLEHFELLLGTNDHFVVLATTRRRRRLLIDSTYHRRRHVVGAAIGEIKRKGLHVLVDHLDVNDRRSVLQTHLFGQKTVYCLVGSDQSSGCRRGSI